MIRITIEYRAAQFAKATFRTEEVEFVPSTLNGDLLAIDQVFYVSTGNGELTVTSKTDNMEILDDIADKATRAIRKHFGWKFSEVEIIHVSPDLVDIHSEATQAWSFDD